MSEKAAKSPAKAPVTKTPQQKQVKRSTSNAAALSQSALSAPADLTQAKVLALQRTAGNQAVQRLLAQHQVQAKLTVGPAHDHYEQEADRVAAQVMAQPTAPAKSVAQRAPKDEDKDKLQAKPLASGITSLAQRAPAPEDDKDEKLQAKSLIQREAVPEEDDKKLQAKSLVQREAAPDEEEVKAKPEAATKGFEAGKGFEKRLNASRGGGAPLPDQTRAFMESRFGADFSDVRIHTGSEAAKLASAIGAQAFTQGKDIYLGEGKENVESTAGKELLAHELTHVVQQEKGGE